MNNTRLQYHATGGQLFILLLKNMFLTVVTLGIYSFWARTNVQKYMAENLEWAGERFSFHGTGKERLIGFLKALGIFVVLYIGIFIIKTILSYIPIPYFAAIVGFVLTMGVFLALVPIIVVGGRKYLTSRTGYRNLRFGFDGKILEVAKIYGKGILLTIITLGIYYPWFFAEKEAYIQSKTRYGNTNFGFQAEGKEIFFLYLKGFLLSIVTLGIYYSWFLADIQNYIWNRTSFQGKKFRSDITGGKIFVNFLIAYLIIFFTLGIGFAWAIVRLTKLFIESVSLEAEVDFSIIEPKADTTANATAEGLEALAEALEGFLS
ncbi:YjgN family protein [Leptospira bandrabouensis]|uniref:DUF898 family protein n=1 Tax=Leptospira bandrabouensis TaxID=2484903 RepID=A0A6H3NWQ3_9LEPT|nr:DUF898 family protein [Leptospira bandrabouensis]MCG6144213.1 DUF898 domain-containing protein [Leptospira bandrabouensis]MCG6150778.1 DUF898 domain-containing protein [Leptospira bandrabouensis]MCG6159874.1 DUF898 domain-containing protein [Leptospira bandrabouensis]MCG6163807.1 DUF898 domain-containing protein [Leptospira bandrabouensis]MCW7476032.1 YjgN family protein [Leptospira bandrabouensis]